MGGDAHPGSTTAPLEDLTDPVPGERIAPLSGPEVVTIPDTGTVQPLDQGPPRRRGEKRRSGPATLAVPDQHRPRVEVHVNDSQGGDFGPSSARGGQCEDQSPVPYVGGGIAATGCDQGCEIGLADDRLGCDYLLGHGDACRRVFFDDPVLVQGPTE